MALKPINKFGTTKQEQTSSAEFFKSKELLPSDTRESTFEAPKEKLDSKDSKDSFEKVGLKRSAVAPIGPDSPVSGAISGKSENLLKIEAILEEDLAQAYFKMDAVSQKKFKLEGEKVSAKIDQLLKKTKDEAKNIFKLIIKWLKMIPGSNKFFVEQEAKIKTDKILKLKK